MSDFYVEVERFGIAKIEDVDNTIPNDLNDIWCQKSNELHEKLKHHNLISKKIYLWNGNQRCKSWMKIASNLYMERNNKHVHVRTLILITNSSIQINVFQACQDLNK